MDPNDSNQTTNPPQTDAAQPDESQADQPQAASNPVLQDDTSAQQPDPNSLDEANTPIPSVPAADQTQPTDLTNTDTANAPQEGNYIDDVGGDMIGLLDEINEDENLIQKVADEMQLDKEKVKSILTGLLNKIDQGQVTAEELAIIMAATVADELTEEPAEETT